VTARYLALAPLLAACTGSHPAAPSAARAPAPAAEASGGRSEIVAFRLHKFMQEIGTERDTYRPVAGGLEARATFAFRDRGSTVSLAATYRLGADGSLRRYQAWGTSSRMSSVDDRIEARGRGEFLVSRDGQPDARVRAAAPFATSGYAPVLGQDLLLRAWVARGRPRSIRLLLPDGTATFESRGVDTIKGEAGAMVKLEHVSVGGLVWGREDVWLDERGRLAAVVTRDAEFDHFEAVRDDLVSLLPELVRTSGADGVARLAKAAEVGGQGGVIALVGGQLIDGRGGPPVKDAVVVIEGDRILAAGPRGTTAVPPGATVFDTSGQSILPGLWDMHAHLQQVEQGAVYLAAGVTTVRDLGNILEFITGVRDAIEAGTGLGPRVLVSGIVDGEGPAAIGTVRIASRADIRPVIDRLVAAGCVEVKIYSSMSPALVRPIAAEAHRRGLRVTGHIPSGMTAVEAIEAGYDGVNHIHSLFSSLLPSAEMRKLSMGERQRRVAAVDLTSPAARKLIDLIARRKIVIDDTIALLELLSHTNEQNRINEPGLGKLPAPLRFEWGVAPALAEPSGAAFAKFLELVGALHRRGVRLVAGSDIAVPGHSVHRELELYVRAGFTPMEAIQAATIVPARVMRLDKQLGTVERGKRADLVVVAGDPLADISAIRKVVRVITRGRTYDPAALWKLADFAP
jgi:imidazolonepropionase-like amidohydrolase